jgi:hypothetical protein
MEKKEFLTNLLNEIIKSNIREDHKKRIISVIRYCLWENSYDANRRSNKKRD